MDEWRARMIWGMRNGHTSFASSDIPTILHLKRLLYGFSLACALDEHQLTTVMEQADKYRMMDENEVSLLSSRAADRRSWHSSRQELTDEVQSRPQTIFLT